MSKIAIISQPDQGVLIDVSGCASLTETLEHLSSTLQASSQFWTGAALSLNLGEQDLDERDLAQVLAIAKGVGISLSSIYSSSERTKQSLLEASVPLGQGSPMSLPEVSFDPDEDCITSMVIEGDDSPSGATSERESNGDNFANLKVRVKNAIQARKIKTRDKVKVSLDGSSIEIKSESESTKSEKTKIELAESEIAEKSIEPVEPVEKTSPAKIETGASSLSETFTTLYLKQTLRSGQTVSHRGNLVIVGDINPGAEVMAEGDITVWGSMRGIAHAGIGGNESAEIRALSLQPIQIRIAHAIARAPDGGQRIKYKSGNGPEIARLVNDKIKVVKSSLE